MAFFTKLSDSFICVKSVYLLTSQSLNLSFTVFENHIWKSLTN